MLYRKDADTNVQYLYALVVDAYTVYALIKVKEYGKFYFTIKKSIGVGTLTTTCTPWNTFRKTARDFIEIAKSNNIKDVYKFEEVH